MSNLTPTEARKLWADALRSGEYQQGKGLLKTKEGTYCCLGVACEVYQKHVGGLAIGNSNGTPTYNGSFLTLPQRVMDWLNIGHNGRLNDSAHSEQEYDLPWGGMRKAKCLSELNDHAGYTFEQIAELIETEGALQGLAA